MFGLSITPLQIVSTHSHPKAAASTFSKCTTCKRSFNTQPPEGGCGKSMPLAYGLISFNTQPPEGGCDVCSIFRAMPVWFQHTATRRRLHYIPPVDIGAMAVSTHSHPKAAAKASARWILKLTSFNTQPPEGGCSLYKKVRKISELNTVFR